MQPDRESELLSLIVDRRSGANDWEEIDNHLSLEPALALRIVTALRDDDLLRSALQAKTAPSVRVGAPTPRGLPWMRRFRPVAAAVLLVAGTFIVARLTAANEVGTPQDTQNIAPATTAAPAPETPRVVRDIDRVVVGHRPAKNGKGVEVLYIHRRLEAVTVTKKIQFGTDENGRPTLVSNKLEAVKTVSAF